MLRATDDVLELRQWAQEHGGAPCRRPDGRLELCFGPDPAPALAVGWGEFETAFVLSRSVLVYDDAPGCRACFVGGHDEARAWISERESARGYPGTTSP